MARIHPFRGYRYDAEKIGDLTAVVSPPYDVIPDAYRHELHLRHQYNAIRLILGEDRSGDDATENRYLRACRYFREWEETGILVRESDEVFYVYEQQYLWKEREWRVRTGLIGAVGLEEYGIGVIFPHEQTMPGPKADRLRLMQGLPVNLEQIFCFYPGPSEPISTLLRRATRTDPLCDFEDAADVRHRRWVLRDSAVIADLVTAFRDRPLFIADGHHRYETALAFRDEIRRTDPHGGPGKAYNFVMMTLVSIEDEGLTILATHRLIRTGWPCGGAQTFNTLKEFFFFEERIIGEGKPGVQTFLQEMEKRGSQGHVFGLYTGGETVSLLTLKDPRVVEEMAEPGRSRHVQTLDVVILERLIFRRLLGLESPGMIDFTQDGEAALHEVRQGRAVAAFLVNPTPVTQITATVSTGERLPPKTTYFYPKLLSGLVFFKVDPNEVLNSVGTWG